MGREGKGEYTTEHFQKMPFGKLNHSSLTLLTGRVGRGYNWRWISTLNPHFIATKLSCRATLVSCYALSVK